MAEKVDIMVDESLEAALKNMMIGAAVIPDRYREIAYSLPREQHPIVRAQKAMILFTREHPET